MKPELKKLLVLNLPYLLFVYLFAKCGQAYRLAAGADASAKLLHLTSGISAAFANPLPSLHLFDLCVGVVGAVAVRLIVYSKGKNAKKYRKGEEYGSARWGTAKDIAPYIDPKFENNILLTQTERLTMTGRPKDPKTARNKNVLVIGGSGSGKTRFYVKPNLMQCFPTSDYPTSFVVTDPNRSVATPAQISMESVASGAESAETSAESAETSTVLHGMSTDAEVSELCERLNGTRLTASTKERTLELFKRYRYQYQFRSINIAQLYGVQKSRASSIIKNLIKYGLVTSPEYGVYQFVKK